MTTDESPELGEQTIKRRTNPRPHHVHEATAVHSHGSLRLQAGSARVTRNLTIAVGLCLLATLAAGWHLRPKGSMPKAPGVTPGTVFVYGQVMTVDPVNCPSQYDATVDCSTARIRVTNGPTAGDIAVLQNTAGIPGSPVVHEGDKIRMAYFAKAPPAQRYTFDDFERGSPLLLLVIVFAVAVILLSWMQGVRALIGMGLSLVVVVTFLLPGLLRGGSPLPLALVTAIAVAFAALYLAHGVHVGTHVAFAGSVLALGLTAALGAAFIAACHFTGYTDENVNSLVIANAHLDVRGLILAGLVVGALGVLDDMTVTQVSAVGEVQRANPSLSTFDLYRAGLRIGRDHVASTVNTLILAYVGASLPLLLLVSQGGRSLGGVLTSEVVAVEMLRAVVGSIGLVAAVPITTGLAAWVVHRPMSERDEGEDDEPDDSDEEPDHDDPWSSFGPDDEFWDRR